MHSYNELEDFIARKREVSSFHNTKMNISDLKDWNFTTKGALAHESGRFFSINSVTPIQTQKSILNQRDIGFLCLFKTVVKNVEYYLLQCKAEPGNENKFQWSPTIQATKSNFSKVHKGNSPPYFDFLISIFKGYQKGAIQTDHLMPEQGEIYWQKYNRNIVIEIDCIEELDGFRWVSKSQLQRLLLAFLEVNSCLRSILSLEFFKPTMTTKFVQTHQTQFCNHAQQNKGNFQISDSKALTFSQDGEIVLFENKNNVAAFVTGLEVCIEGREVGNWQQPIIRYNKESNKAAIRVKSRGNILGWLWCFNNQPGYLLGTKIGLMQIDKAEALFSSDANIKPVKIAQVSLPEEGGRFLNVKNRITFLQIDVSNFDEFSDHLDVSEEVILLNDSETVLQNKLGNLEMDARSALTLSSCIFDD